MSEGQFDPYNIDFNGFKLDPYRIIDIFKVEHPAMQQVVKKALRQGAKHKDEEQDARDIITSAQRFLDMKAEERRWKNEPELPFPKTARPKIINGHVLTTPESCKNCRNPNHTSQPYREQCAVCDDGLGVCINCGAAEVELETYCPKA